MTDLIRDLARIDLPSDLLEQIDMAEVLARFRQKFRKLDDLKKFREKHEQRNFISRWWNNNELDDAQLNAQELQADFSKTLGQLMVISMLQSQRLEQQQLLMARQQDQIKRQADSIEQNTGELAVQHSKLREQGESLEKLVNDYFALRGLTQEGARKLIEIANEVKATKDMLLDTFDRQILQVQERAEVLEHMVEDGLRTGRDIIERERALVGERFSDISAAMTLLEAGTQVHQAAQAERFDKLEKTAAGLSTRIQDARVDAATRIEQLDTSVARLELTLREQHETASAEIRRLKSSLWKVTGVAAGGLGVGLLAYFG